MSKSKITREEKTLNADLRLRVNADSLSNFKEKSKRVAGVPYQVFVRKLIEAFNNGKLSIAESEEVKREKKVLYK